MILLDINVISEPLKPNGEPRVVTWIDAQVLETLYLSAITLAELRYGIAALPEGKRKAALRAGLEERVLPMFDSRILPFDAESTEAYAALCVRARSAGKGIGIADAYIAAIAATRGFTVATRDTAAFEAAGVAVVNPWEEGADSSAQGQTPL
ncbi:MAG: type II toxin-antitoxin system VapC family toxin [Steroidobacteraceae bacterium]